MFEKKYKKLMDQVSPRKDHRVEVKAAMESELRNNTPSRRQMFPAYRYAAVAAVILLVVTVLYQIGKPDPGTVPVAQGPTQTQPVSTTPAATSAPPLLYSGLQFAPSAPLTVPVTVVEGSGRIAPFTEELLRESTAVFKGKVLAIRFKDYADPSNPNVIQRQTVIYEVMVETIYSGESLKAGVPVILENDLYTYTSLDGVVDRLKVGRRYILPVVSQEPGDMAVESTLSVLYPFAPPIEVTLDGKYVFPDHWTSLINDFTRTVTMDEGKPMGMFDTMLLRGDATFETDFQKLVDSFTKSP